MTKAIGERLKAFRESFDLSQTDMGASIGVPQTTWSNYEKGANEFKSDFVAKLQSAYGISLEWLFSGQGPVFRTEIEEERQRLRKENAELREKLALLENSNKALELAVTRLGSSFRMRVQSTSELREGALVFREKNKRRPKKTHSSIVQMNERKESAQ